MHSVHRNRNIFKIGRKSEGGFVFIAAIMAVMILMAVGFFALTVTSQDILISSWLVGERKALSAAEAGVHQVCIALNPLALAPGTITYVDLTNDSSTSYTYTLPVRNLTMPKINVPGGDISKGYEGAVFNTTVTGSDASYNSTVSIDIGTVYSPNPGDTRQGP